MKPTSNDLETSWGKVIFILGTLATLIAIAAQLMIYYPYFRKGFTYFVMLFMFIIMLLIFAKPLRMKFEKWKEERRLSSLAEQQFPFLEELVDRFKEFIIPNRSDNIPYIVQKFSGVEMLSISEIQVFFSIYEECIKNIGRPWTKFFLSIRYFEWILSIYNKYCVCKPIEKIIKLDAKYNKEKQRYKKDYGRYKRKYLSFIDDYVIFVKKLNSKFSTQQFKEYFQEPEDF